MDHQSGASKDQQGHQRHGGGEEVKVTYVGVARQKSGNYGAKIRDKTKKNGKQQVWLGTFPTPEEAARAYDLAAVAMGRHKYTLNFPDEHRTTISGGATTSASTLAAVAATSSSSTSSMATREVIFEFEDLLDPDMYDDKVNN